MISPLLANVYLHYALDLWFERAFRKDCTGHARLIRYADDFVACFQNGQDARRFRETLVERLGKFKLEVEASKTKVFEFGPMATARATRRGARKAETFDFLGLTHYCSRTRDGKRFRMKRVTARKRSTRSVAAFKEWVMGARTKPTCAIWNGVCQRLRGHYAYYGVTDNSPGIVRFAYVTKRLLWRWLNRRGGRRRLTWERFGLMEARHPLPPPRIRVSLF